MDDHHPRIPVPVFFYGGLINRKMQERVGVTPAWSFEAALPGYSLTIRPYVDVHEAGGETVFGLVMCVRHADLERLYSQLKVRYHPIPVLVRRKNGMHMPALCYVAGGMPPGPADEAHVRMLLEPAEELGFPSWYLRRIRSFLP